MDSIFENPLARMYGPLFLFFYAFLFAIAYWFIKNKAFKIAGKVENENDTVIPLQPDPYEIAYTRGRDREVALLVIYTLIKREYFSLLTNKEKKNVVIKKKKTDAEINALNILERSVFNCLKNELSLKQLVEKAERNEEFIKQCSSLEIHLQQQKIVWSDNERERFKKIRKGIIIFLVCIGLYRTIAAIMHSHFNVIFLLAEMVIGSFMLADISFTRAFTSKGEKVIDNYKNTFKAINGEVLLQQPFFILQLQLAIYGFVLLQNSKHEYLYEYIRSQLLPAKKTIEDWWPTSQGGGSSSSCSSSCGGGGSCGGGCGGCGGCS